jgi:hypothetical protein
VLRTRQQRFNELEQAQDAAAIRLDDVTSDGPDPPPLLRIGQEPRHGGRQLSRIVHLESRALLEQ